MPFALPEVTTLYKKDSNLTKKDVEILREWLTKQPHLPELKEMQLILFLHSCYYKLEETKLTIENYFTLRTHSDLFKNITKEKTREILSTSFIAFLPKRTDEGDVILSMKLLDPRPQVYNCREHTKVILIIMMLYLHQFEPANGLIVVFDMEGTSFGHLFRMNLSILRQLVYFVQEAAPIRIKAIHHINSIPLAQRLVHLVKPFMKKHIYDMIKFHTPPNESFFQYVPKECLPEDYGGLLPSIIKLQKQNITNIIENWDFFEWHYTQKVDENKRFKKQRGVFSSIQGVFH